MGMGEPLANYKNVMEAVRRINTELGIGARHITISTVGLVPRILRLSQEDIQVHACAATAAFSSGMSPCWHWCDTDVVMRAFNFHRAENRDPFRAGSRRVRPPIEIYLSDFLAYQPTYFDVAFVQAPCWPRPYDFVVDVYSLVWGSRLRLVNL